MGKIVVVQFAQHEAIIYKIIFSLWGSSVKMTKIISILFLCLMLVLSGCSSNISPEAYVAEGAYITGNGAYEITGDAVALKSVLDGENGWKNFSFDIKCDNPILELYLVSLESDVLLDEIIVKSGNTDLLCSNFDNAGKIKGRYGWTTYDSGKNGACIFSTGTARDMLSLVEDGTAVLGEWSDATADGTYELSFWVNFDWETENYNNLFYIGFQG